MKKLISLTLAAVMLLALLAGCGAKAETPAETQAAAAETQAAAAETEAAAPVSQILRFGANSEPTGFDPHTDRKSVV